jgi:hypothetical protein
MQLAGKSSLKKLTAFIASRKSDGMTLKHHKLKLAFKFDQSFHFDRLHVEQK